MPDLQDFMTVDEAAARLGCSSATIWRRIADGRLPAYRLLGRTVVREEDVDRLEIPCGGARRYAVPE